MQIGYGEDPCQIDPWKGRPDGAGSGGQNQFVILQKFFFAGIQAADLYLFFPAPNFSRFDSGENLDPFAGFKKCRIANGM